MVVATDKTCHFYEPECHHCKSKGHTEHMCPQKFMPSGKKSDKQDMPLPFTNTVADPNGISANEMLADVCTTGFVSSVEPLLLQKKRICSDPSLP